ncbi:hypothetical protein [Aliarcobacter butzleri]|uniref:hypothetical protein n=1 Tax=Aliarcobacter butzleri TaxID=28197 RepID=UPI00102D9257|nr:hypothetical protein [Aliarcobacter butzleri]RZV18663.1 hypothetical protein D3M75_05070 [Aliarcobacter butzleri]
MGMCKGCGIVFNANDMKDGYCKSCKPEFFTKEYDEEQKKIKLKEVEEKTKKDNSNLKMAFLISMVLIIIGVAFFVYETVSKPNEATIKNLASQYPIGPLGMEVLESQIKILNNYNKDGKIYYIIQVGQRVCDMPMLKIEGTWNALGISCK